MKPADNMATPCAVNNVVDAKTPFIYTYLIRILKKQGLIPEGGLGGRWYC